jgi:threonine dehydrogenase-like Zn-dependent dehydrogenase
MKADAIWVVEPKKIEVRTVDVTEPGYGEVQIETKACGVCAWDSYLYQCISAPGPAPYRIGHEAVGIVHKVGEGVTNAKKGDKVFCASGSNEMMCQYFNMNSSGVARIPDDVTDYWNWVAEPTVCVVNLLYKTNIEPGDSVVLVGAGYMGLITLQGLIKGSQAGSITVFEKRPEMLERARKYSPAVCFDPYSEEGKAEIEKIIAKGGADVVIEFGASDSGYKLAYSMTSKRGGKFVLGSWHRHEMAFDGTDWHMSGLTVYNLSPSSNRRFSEMIPRTAELIKKGVYNPAEFVTHVANYKDASKVFEHSIQKTDGYLKGVITF